MSDTEKIQSDILTTSSNMIDELQGFSDRKWEEFVSVYTPLIMFWIRKHISDQHTQLDILQDCLMSIAKGITDFEEQPQKGAFRSWLKTITHRRVVDYFRENQLQPVVNNEYLIEQTVDQIKPDEETEEEHLAFEELSARAMQIVHSSMTGKSWDMFWMSVVQNVPTREIALKYGVSQGAVRMARGRVLNRLRELLPDM